MYSISAVRKFLYLGCKVYLVRQCQRICKHPRYQIGLILSLTNINIFSSLFLQHIYVHGLFLQKLFYIIKNV
jgi:hypothetical protein